MNLFKAYIVKLLFFLCLFEGIYLNGQSLSVQSFRQLSFDLDARVSHPVLDQNGEKAALLKIQTTEQGFIFEGGSLGIVSIKQKVGEIWVYVPRGARRLTIKHEQLGVLRDYIYPMAIKSATVYEVQLVSAKVRTVVVGPVINSQYIVVTSNPEGADVYINDIHSGTTPLQKELKKGEHKYRVEKVNYVPQEGVVTVGEEKEHLDLVLQSTFVSLYVLSEPEPGAAIWIDGKNTGKKTPTVLENVSEGRHILQLRHPWFSPKQEEILVSRGQEGREVTVKMDANYATVKIKSLPEADVLVDGETIVLAANGEKNMRISPGIHTFQSSMPSHKAIREKLEINVGEVRTIDLSPLPMYGGLNVQTSQIGLSFSLSGRSRTGTYQTPVIFDKLLVGQYNVEYVNEQGKTVSHRVEITENQVSRIFLGENTRMKVHIYSLPIDNVAIYIDGEYKGQSPCEVSLEEGKTYTVSATNKEGYAYYKKPLTVQKGKHSYVIRLEHSGSMERNSVSSPPPPVAKEARTKKQSETVEQDHSDRPARSSGSSRRKERRRNVYLGLFFNPVDYFFVSEGLSVSGAGIQPSLIYKRFLLGVGFTPTESFYVDKWLDSKWLAEPNSGKIMTWNVVLMYQLIRSSKRKPLPGVTIDIGASLGRESLSFRELGTSFDVRRIATRFDFVVQGSIRLFSFLYLRGGVDLPLGYSIDRIDRMNRWREHDGRWGSESGYDGRYEEEDFFSPKRSYIWRFGFFFAI